MAEETEVEKPKKTRKPRAKKVVEAAPPTEMTVVAPPEDRKKPKHLVEHVGRVVTLTGKDVFVKELPPAMREKWGIKEVTGTLGAACVTPVVITFKSPKAAEAFFDAQLNEEDEELELVVAGNKTEWHGPSLGSYGE